MSALGPGCVKTPTLNLRVEFLSQFRRCGNRLHRRLLLREDNSARPWLKRVVTQPGSKPEKLTMSTCFPLFTQQRTSPRYFGMSVSCQKETRAPHQITSLFDHLVRA